MNHSKSPQRSHWRPRSTELFLQTELIPSWQRRRCASRTSKVFKKLKRQKLKMSLLLSYHQQQQLHQRQRQQQQLIRSPSTTQLNPLRLQSLRNWKQLRHRNRFVRITFRRRLCPRRRWRRPNRQCTSVALHSNRDLKIYNQVQIVDALTSLFTELISCPTSGIFAEP